MEGKAVATSTSSRIRFIIFAIFSRHLTRDGGNLRRFVKVVAQRAIDPHRFSKITKDRFSTRPVNRITFSIPSERHFWKEGVTVAFAAAFTLDFNLDQPCGVCWKEQDGRVLSRFTD